MDKPLDSLQEENTRAEEELLETQEEKSLAESDLVEEEYKIFEYFKEHTGLLVTCVSALVAIMSFLLHFAVGRMNYSYLAYWNISSLYANTSNQSELDMVVCAFLYIVALFLMHGFLWKTADVYQHYNKILSVTKEAIKRRKRENKKVFNTYNIAFGLEPFVPEGFDEIHKMDELHTYLPKADVLVCCLPGIGTAHLIGEEELRLLKDDAILVNVGRGTLIDNLALASVMREGKLLGAALDVTDPEPLPGGHPLWGIDNLIITPHVAGPTFCHCPLTEDKVIAQVCANLEKYLEDGSFPNQVN